MGPESMHITHGYYFWDSVYTRQYVSLAAVICLLWEHALTIEHEYTFVWKSRLTITKILYLSLRYITLIYQITNHIISSIVFSKPILGRSTCATWFTYQCVGLQVSLTLFEMILLVRVWALYKMKHQVGYCLGTLQACELGGSVYGAYNLISVVKFGPTCLIDHTPRIAIYLAVTPMIMQAVIFSMTWCKRINSAQEWEAERYKSIVSLMLRDGLAVLFLLCTLLTLFLCLTIFVHTMNHSIWTILTTVLSIGGCRVIINMQQLKVPMNVSLGALELERTSCVGSSCFRSIQYLTSIDGEEYEQGIEPDVLLK